MKQVADERAYDHEAVAVRPRRPDRNNPEKVVVEPPDFPRLLSGGAVVGSTDIDLMVWPHLTDDRPGMHAERVQPDEAHAALSRTHLFMADPENAYSARVNHWLGLDELDRHIVPVVNRVAATVPCYRLQGSADPPAIGSEIRAVIPAGPGFMCDEQRRTGAVITEVAIV